MNLENIALDTLGAKIIEHSSSSDEDNYPPSNVISENEEVNLIIDKGLPQFIIISLEDVELKYSHIARIGFYCWHDYTTNPKAIELEVAPANGEKFIMWARLTLKQKSGKQHFDIQPLPSTYRVLKITITETFGDYQTYLNQIYIMAQFQESQLNSMLAINDLQSPMRKSYAKESNQYKQINYRQKYAAQQGYNQQDSVSDESQEEQRFEENTFHNKQNYVSSSKRSYSKHSSKSSKFSEVHQNDKSLQNDIALLTLSKNVMEMQENIQEIKRSLQVLNVKIDVTYDKLEQRILGKVQDLIDKKLQKMKNELKNQMKRTNQLRESKSQHEKMEFLKSKDYKGDYQEEQKPKDIREVKQSLHIHNLKSNRVERQSSKELIVTDLMDKLAKKLKERQLKIKKIESKREREKGCSDNRSGLHRQPFI